MKYFFLCLLFSVLCGTGKAEVPEKLYVRISGNGYVTSPGARINRNGTVSDWNSSDAVISLYFYLDQAEKPELFLVGKGDSELKVSCAGRSFPVVLKSAEWDTVPVGAVEVSEPGYVRIDLQGVKKQGETFGEVQGIVVGNIRGKAHYVTGFSDYWGRRGPSVHMGDRLPEGDTEWFYNELTVPAEGDIIGSYYMANGFGEGYFGIQHNSEKERRVLFSVWSPYDTQDPKDIPEEFKIKMLRQGEGVRIGEFGNEGSGGQSYLIYPWKADVTYKFLTRVQPDGKGNTVYTAYFYATDEGRWRLIACFLRPQTDTWYKRPHSFLENFNPNQGYLTRSLLMGNQWARSTAGEWRELTEGTFTYDATAAAGVRLDYAGGLSGEHCFFLKNGGFFNENTTIRSKFTRKGNGTAPEIDFSALEKL